MWSKFWDLDANEYKREEGRGDFRYTWKIALLSLLAVIPLLGGVWVLKSLNNVLCGFLFG